MKPSILWPVVGKYPISFSFGEAPEWYTKCFGYPHNGIDIACPIGTSVVATEGGVVNFADDIPDSDGKGLLLCQAWGISCYWHLSELKVKYGERVQRGQEIAKSGNTGYVTGPHVHFAIKVIGDEPSGMRGWTDPVKYIEGDVSTPVPSLPIQRTYIVGFGDTLWKIAEKFYNNGTEWRRIYEANKEKIKNPNVIFPLQRFLIP
jgi:murein DD-endopeptidase MepM/ murein hydrolase activator NlpD